MVYRIEKDENIKLATELLLNGNIIIYSTDTLYGFGVDATNSRAIKKLNEIKGRSQPYSIIVSSFSMLKKYAVISNNIENELKSILPGPFTVILNKTNSNLSQLVNSGLPTLGIRIPDFNPILRIVDKINKPIITTSVNYHGQNSLNNLDLINKTFSNIDIFTNNKEKKSLGSTIIDFSIKPFKVLRNGDGTY